MFEINPKLQRCFTFGVWGNICFFIFSIICFIYYQLFGHLGDLPIIKTSFETMAYVVEGIGFVFMLLAMIWFARTVRQRIIMKIFFLIYILTELALMVLELSTYRVIDFYNPYSFPLALAHAIFSAFTCFTFLSLDPKRTALEVVIVVSVGIMLTGMLGYTMNYRIYYSILTNALGFAFMFTMIKFLLRQERMEIDCYGDKARVLEYRSDFFD